MQLLTNTSKTSQVASRLRQMIKKDNLRPGSRLAGTRQLAQEFNVSAKTVKCAMDLLQEEGLVRCEHGRGIFVQPRAQAGEIEVYIMLWGMRRESCNYFQEIIKLAYPPALQPGYAFTLRSVFKDTDDFKHFDQELARIENSPHIRCVLTSAAQYNVEHFEKLEQLHCPVVYFGDSKYEEAVDYPRHRIIDTADKAQACLAVLKHLQEKEVTLFVPDGSIVFYKEFTRTVVMGASQAGIKLNLFEVPTSLFAEMDQNKVAKVYARQIDKAHTGGQLDCPVMLYGMINPIFLANSHIQQRLTSTVPFIEPQLASSSMEPFYRATFDLISSVVDAPGEIQTRSICNDILVQDLGTEHQYWFKSGVLESADSE